MVFFLLIFFSQSKNTQEKYGHCINLLSEKLPIDKNQMETKTIIQQYIQYFNGRPPSYKEKEQICLNNKNLFERVGKEILESVNLDRLITSKQMVRCISRNLPLFAYTVVYMANGQHSSEIGAIKNNFLDPRNSHVNFARKVYVTPQIPRTDLEQEELEDDFFLTQFLRDVDDDFNYF